MKERNFLAKIESETELPFSFHQFECFSGKMNEQDSHRTKYVR